MFDYAAVAKSAELTIRHFGGDAVFYTPAIDGEYDPDTGEAVISAGVEVESVVTPLMRYSRTDIDGTAVLANDAYVLASSEDAPLVGMFIELNGVCFVVVSVTTVQSLDGVKVYHKVQLRA